MHFEVLWILNRAQCFMHCDLKLKMPIQSVLINFKLLLFYVQFQSLNFTMIDRDFWQDEVCKTV